MLTPTPVPFEVKDNGKMTVIVTALNGKKYLISSAQIVLAVTDTGQVNPLDGVPLFQITAQVLVQTREAADA